MKGLGRVLTFVLVAVALAGCAIVLSMIARPGACQLAWQRRTAKAQAGLAQQLGVRMRDYQYPGDFPVGYFSAVLWPGMTFQQVHGVIQGYKQVSVCGGANGFRTEFYDFFGANQEDRLRLLINYDNGLYTEMQEENVCEGDVIGLLPDCAPGLLGQ